MTTALARGWTVTTTHFRPCPVAFRAGRVSDPAPAWDGRGQIEEDEMTNPDAEALSAALTTATGQPWTSLLAATGAIWLWPAAGGSYPRVDCWCRDGKRRVILRRKSGAPSEWMDVEQGRGWPARAAAAVVYMLGER